MRIAELLLEAGYLPTTFERVWVSEDGCWALPVLQPRFAPLADRPHWFPSEGRARWVVWAECRRRGICFCWSLDSELAMLHYVGLCGVGLCGVGKHAGLFSQSE